MSPSALGGNSREIPAGVPGPESDRSLVLLRLGGDISTKSRATRGHFERRLVRNLKDALRSEGFDAPLERNRDRIFVHSEDPGAEAVLARVPGIQSLSRVVARPWRGVPDLVEAGSRLFGEAVRGRRFAVRARRVGNRSRIGLDVSELIRELGTALLPGASGVDLERPEVTVRVEVGPDRACFFRESLSGPGGLPLGVEGRAVALVSGGFDSPVAAWAMQKRGVQLDYVFCNLGGRTHQLGTLRVVKEIADRWSYGTRPRFHAIDFDAVSEDLQQGGQARLWQVVLKRLMYRAAERVAEECGGSALVTGEAVGQVSSQTLPNLAVISRVCERPVLRPLIGFNKDEILALARHIGTHDLSKVVGEYCALVPRRPATAAREAEVLREEERLDPALLDRAVAERSVFDLRELDLEKLELPGLAATGVPPEAVVLDLRSIAAYRGWHFPGALFLEFGRALQAFPGFERGRPYVLYCEFGLKSAHLAERMREAGFDARHFPRGLRDVLAHARERGLPVPDPS